MVLYVPKRSISMTVLNPFGDRPSIGDRLHVLVQPRVWGGGGEQKDKKGREGDAQIACGSADHIVDPAQFLLGLCYCLFELLGFAYIGGSGYTSPSGCLGQLGRGLL